MKTVLILLAVAGPLAYAIYMKTELDQAKAKIAALETQLVEARRNARRDAPARGQDWFEHQLNQPTTLNQPNRR